MISFRDYEQQRIECIQKINLFIKEKTCYPCSTKYVDIEPRFLIEDVIFNYEYEHEIHDRETYVFVKMSLKDVLSGTFKVKEIKVIDVFGYDFCECDMEYSYHLVCESIEETQHRHHCCKIRAYKHIKSEYEYLIQALSSSFTKKCMNHEYFKLYFDYSRRFEDVGFCGISCFECEFESMVKKKCDDYERFVSFSEKNFCNDSTALLKSWDPKDD